MYLEKVLVKKRSLLEQKFLITVSKVEKYINICFDWKYHRRWYWIKISDTSGWLSCSFLCFRQQISVPGVPPKEVQRWHFVGQRAGGAESGWGPRQESSERQPELVHSNIPLLPGISQPLCSHHFARRVRQATDFSQSQNEVTSKGEYRLHSWAHSLWGHQT